MLFQIAHRLPAIEKNRWPARWEIYLLHARARALGKVQQFGHPGALSDANARIIQRTSACTGGRVLGMEMWRDIWSRFIMGKGGGEWVIREGHCLSLILKCHLHEMSPLSIYWQFADIESVLCTQCHGNIECICCEVSQVQTRSRFYLQINYLAISLEAP